MRRIHRVRPRPGKVKVEAELDCAVRAQGVAEHAGVKGRVVAKKRDGSGGNARQSTDKAVTMTMTMTMMMKARYPRDESNKPRPRPRLEPLTLWVSAQASRCSAEWATH